MRPPIIHQPFAYDLGPLQITGFGLAVMLGFVIAQIISQRELARRGHDPEPIADLVFAAVIGGLLGGKIYYAILTGDVGSLLSRSGLVFWGGLIGGIVATYVVMRRRGLPFTRISDVGGMGVAAAHSVGRTGCWAVGDDYGRPWTSPFAARFPEGAPPSTAENMQQLFGARIPEGVAPQEVLSVHPTQLYETVLLFAAFFVLWRLRGHRHAEGWLFGLYCVLAGAERFVIEFFRAKDDRFFGPLTVAQVIALLFMAGGAAWMYARRSPRAGAPGIYAASVAPVPAV